MMLAALAALVLGLGALVGAMLHHEWRATAAARAPSPVRRALPWPLAWVPSALALAGLVALATLPSAPRPRPEPGLALLGLALLAVLAFGPALVGYLAESITWVADPARLVASAPNAALGVELLAHRAVYGPPVARTTLVRVSGGRRQRLCWSERPMARTRAACLDPQLLALAGSAPVTVGSLGVPGLGAELPPA